MTTGTVQLNVRVAPALLAKLRRLADREKTTLGYEVNVALRAHLDASEQRRKGAMARHAIRRGEHTNDVG